MHRFCIGLHHLVEGSSCSYIQKMGRVLPAQRSNNSQFHHNHISQIWAVTLFKAASGCYFCFDFYAWSLLSIFMLEGIKTLKNASFNSKPSLRSYLTSFQAEISHLSYYFFLYYGLKRITTAYYTRGNLQSCNHRRGKKVQFIKVILRGWPQKGVSIGYDFFFLHSLEKLLHNS